MPAHSELLAGWLGEQPDMATVSVPVFRVCGDVVAVVIVLATC